MTQLIPNAKKAGMIFAIISAITWGTYGIFYSILLEVGISDLALVALAPLALVVYFGIRVAFKPRVLKAIPLRYYVGLLAQGAIIGNGMNYCYAQAYSAGMPVGVVSTVAFCNVLVIMVESYFIFKYKFSAAKIISMVLALVGISLVLGIFGGETGRFTGMGLMWTIFIPFFFGTNVTLNTYFINKKVDSDAILFLTQGMAVIFMLTFQIHPIALFENVIAATESNAAVWLFLLGFCAIPQALCYAMMQECLKRIEPAIMGIVYSLDPVTALILGLLVFAQPPSIVQLIGVVLILSAVTYINYAEGREATIENGVDKKHDNANCK